MFARSLFASFALFLSGVVSGCLDVTPPEGRLACSRDDECPPSWVCDAQRCYRARSDAGMDAPVDVPGSDVPGSDVPIDAGGRDVPSERDAPIDVPGWDAGDAPSCRTGADCDDHDVCTADACEGTCRHDAIACDDGVPCTLDACSAAAGCAHVRDDRACGTGRTCSPGAAGADANGCVAASGCTSATECDDALFCTDDTCEGSRCVHRPHVCPDDGDDCTSGVACDEAADACVSAFAPSTTMCRGVAGMCDVPEFCTGTSAGCPADRFATSAVVCRHSAGQCDQEERCGGGPSCPIDLPATDGTPCELRCGVEECRGGACTGGLTCSGIQVCICDAACLPRGSDCP